MKKIQYLVWSRKRRAKNYIDFEFAVYDKPLTNPVDGVVKLRPPGVDPKSTIPVGHSYQFVLRLTFFSNGTDTYVLNANNNYTIEMDYSIMNNVSKAEIIKESGFFKTEIKVNNEELEIDFPWNSQELFFVTNPAPTYLKVDFKSS